MTRKVIPSPHETLQIALSLAGLGWHVFPVRLTTEKQPDGTTKRHKKPLVKWHDGATTDPETIATWWGGEFARDWIGVHAAKSELVVVDLDEDKGEGAGRDNLAAAGIDLPETFSYRTRGGGSHHVYAAPTGRALTIAEGKPVPGVDIRAGVGLTVYYGPELDAAAKIAPAPDWALFDAKPKAAERDPSATLAAWLKAAPKGKPSKAVRKIAGRIQSTGTSHKAMLKAQDKLTRLGSRGEPGAADALLAARARYIDGWGSEYAAAFDAAAEDRVKLYGLPPTTFELSKAERRAIKARNAPQPERAKRAATLHVDVAAAFAGGLEPRRPTAGSERADGLRLLYTGAVNGLMGASEVGKSIIASAMVSDELRRDGRAVWVDVDHNGIEGTLRRFALAGIDPATLSDPARFRLYVPGDKAELEATVRDAASMAPTIAVVDSVGEVMSMLGADSNSADDYAAVHRATFSPLAASGAAVLVVDHLAKSAATSGYASGTGQKKTALDGASYEVRSVETFRPGAGGAAALMLRKDRFGGIRAKTEGEQAATFRLDSRADAWTWDFHTPRDAEQRDDDRLSADVAFVLALDPFPSSKERLIAAVRDATGKGWRNDRAHAALAAARLRRATTFPLNTEPDTKENES